MVQWGGEGVSAVPTNNNWASGPLDKSGDIEICCWRWGECAPSLTDVEFRELYIYA